MAVRHPTDAGLNAGHNIPWNQESGKYGALSLSKSVCLDTPSRK